MKYSQDSRLPKEKKYASPIILVIFPHDLSAKLEKFSETLNPSLCERGEGEEQSRIDWSFVVNVIFHNLGMQRV